jgi:hypothetical protein
MSPPFLTCVTISTRQEEAIELAHVSVLEGRFLHRRLCIRFWR